MNRKQAISKGLETFPHPIKSEIVTKFVEEIYDAESGTCENCKHYQCEVCVNDESPLCADFVSNDFGCNKFEPREETQPPISERW